MSIKPSMRAGHVFVHRIGGREGRREGVSHGSRCAGFHMASTTSIRRTVIVSPTPSPKYERVCCFNNCPSASAFVAGFLFRSTSSPKKPTYALYLIVGFRGLSAYKHKHMLRRRSINHKIASEMLERPQARDAVRRDIIAGNQDQGARGVAVQFPGLDR